MLILKRERHLIAQRPAEPTSQIAMLQLLQLTQHRAIALVPAALKQASLESHLSAPSVHINNGNW